MVVGLIPELELAFFKVVLKQLIWVVEKSFMVVYIEKV